MSVEYPIELHRVLLVICDLCLNGKGGECHVPGCSFYLNRAPDLPLTPREGESDLERYADLFALQERGATTEPEDT